MRSDLRKLGIFVALVLLAGAGGWLLLERSTASGVFTAADLATRVQSLFTGESAAADHDAASQTTQQNLPAGASEDWLAQVQKDLEQKQWGVREVDADELPAGITATHWAPNPAHNLKTYFTANGIAVRPFNVEVTSEQSAAAQPSAAQSTAGDEHPEALSATDDATANTTANATADAMAPDGPAASEIPADSKQPWEFSMSLAGIGARGAVADADVAVQNIAGNRVEYQRGNVTEWYVNDGNGLEQGFTVTAPPADVSDELVLTLNIDGNLSARVISSEMVALDDGDGDAELYLRNLLVKDANDAVLPAQFASVNGQLAIAVDVGDASYPIVVDPVLSAVATYIGSNQQSAYLGNSVAAAGDVNNDGYGDVIVGATKYDDGQGNDVGAAFVYLGSASGLAATPSQQLAINQVNANFASSVAAAGDVNGDGYGDVIVGAPFYDNGQTDEGAAFLYLGSASGLVATPAWQGESNQVSAYFGYAVAAAGDVNGDGFGDVIIGAPYYDNVHVNEGAAFMYLGSAGGLVATPFTWQPEGNQTDAQFGYSVAAAGDVNGDGFGDVIVGAPYYDNGQTNDGSAYVYLGSLFGPIPTAAWQAEGNQSQARFGHSVAAAGDVNGDGYGDVIVGANQYSNGQGTEGAAFVYLGSASGVATTAVWQGEGNQGGAQFGSSVAAAGDVNGDGFGDVIAGAPYYQGLFINEGAAFVYLGSAGGLTTTVAWQAEGNQNSALFGWSLASAGDVNGDGYGDVIIGAPYYDNGQTDEGAAFVYLGSASGLAADPAWQGESNLASAGFGYSVAAAGDVNGDGYGDVIVGANTYTNGATSEGAAFVYLGSASGLAATPVWTAESNLASAQFGYSVAAAGDVNGDGYADVIVGAHQYANGQSNEGAAFVYLGSASGVAATPAWQAEGNQAGAQFGFSVAAAGDVNGDGFGDVIVGAPYYDNGESDEGVAFVYLGSAGGLAAIPAWQGEGNRASASVAGSVAGAGDINGDGFGDVIVSVRNYTVILDINTEPGSASTRHFVGAFVYLGSATGLASTPAWQATNPDPIWDFFGNAVASAGDVNGDGYGDVMVGAPYYGNGEGAALVYLGGASGPASAPVWQVVGNPGGGLFGKSLASAGDINGDGYGDVIIGAGQYGQNGEDAVLGYVSDNANPALVAGPRQHTSGNTPVASLGSAAGLFVAKMNAYSSTAQGNQAKLVVESCKLPAAFGTAGCEVQESASWQTVVPSGTALSANIAAQLTDVYGLGSNFTTDGLYRWRAQLLYNVNPAKALPWAPRRAPWRYYQGDLAKSVVDIVIDADNDSIRDRLDSDDDNDGVLDTVDAFPQNNAEAYDTDGDGTGDNADTDDDGDGTPDSTDPNVGTPSLLLSNLGTTVTATAGTAFNLDINAGWEGAGRTTTWYSGTPYYVLQKSDGAGGWITLTVNGSGLIQDSELGWLTFDPATGELSGFPQSGNTGVYNLRLVVTNGSGGSAYDIDLNGDGSSLAPAFDFTFTVPENFAPSVTINALGSGGYVTSEPIISGTASDPEAALDRIDIQIFGDNGTAYINGDIVSGAAVWNTICTGNSCSNWQLNTTAENYIDSVNYTVRARARDTSGNTTIAETDFTFYGGAQTYTTLQLIPNSTSILFEDTMQLNVKLAVPGNAGANLAGLPVVIRIERPADSLLPDPDELIRSVAADGTFTQPLLLGSPGSPVQFDETGDWKLSARFNVDPPTLPQYQAVTSNNVTLSVGASAGYAVLVQGKVSTGEGQLEHNKTLNRIYRTMTRRNLRDQDIYYYNHNASQDANQDGYPDNNNFFNPYQGVDDVPDKATVQSTIENIGLLARSNPGPVWIVLHDHGNRVSDSSVFQLTPTVTISPSELDTWIDTLENNLYNGTGITAATAPVIIVNAYCYSGGFIQALSKPGRIIISSASDVEASYKGPLEDDGLRSGELFAEALFEELGYDQDIYTAFSEATAKSEDYTRSADALNPNTAYPYFDTSVQHPLLDDNGDGVGSNELSPSAEGDGLAALTVKLGTGLTVLTNSVESPAALLRVTPTRVLNPATDHAELWAEPNFPSYVAARFYEVRPPAVVLPGGIQGSEQLEAESYTRHIMGGIGNCPAPNNQVYCTDHGTAATAPDTFTVPGKYEVFYYVKDSDTGALSPQLKSTVYKQLAGNLAPPAPALTYPANAAANVFRAALLEWTGVIDPDLTGSPITYTVRIATDAAMTNIVYIAEEVPYAFHQVPLEAGLDFSTTYYWDVEAIDGYGASLDRNGSGVWSPSAPFAFTTENSGNNIYGVVHGAIRGLTASNQVITSLTNASIAQTNNTALSERVSYDPTIQNSNGTTGAYAYTVWALPGTVNLQATATNFTARNRTGITIQADQTITGQNFLLAAEVVPVTVRVNNDQPLHAHHNHAPAGGLPDDVVPVNVYGSAAIPANLINPASIRVGPGQAPDRNNAAVFSQVNGDGIQDATFDVWMSASQIACNATQVTVTGETTGGVAFSGTDTVTTDCNAVCH